MSAPNMLRRQLIGGGIASLAAPRVLASSSQSDFWARPRLLALRRPVTGEAVAEVYWENGQLVPAGLQRLNHILRDVHANEVREMDQNLLDILTGIQGWFRAYGQNRWIEINSGYRTARTNEHTEGAAKNSQHLIGKAADIRIEGVPSDYLFRLGQYLQGGGVGWYPNANFVHVDTGRVRTWLG
jgi:uncharacterized protein YcbK (DUF882 family)